MKMKSTNQKRYLWFSSMIVIGIACITMGYIYLVNTDNDKQKQKDSVISGQIINEPEKLTDEKCIPICDTKECTSLAAIILKRMDSTIDPCDNFDSFLCGGFKKQFGPDEYSFILNILQTASSNTLKDILNNIERKPGHPSSKLRTAYDSCVSVSSELRAVQTFLSFLNDLGISNWPNLAPDFQLNETNFLTILGKLMVYFDFFFHFEKKLDSSLGDEKNYMSFKVYFFSAADDKMLNISEEQLAHVLDYFDLNAEEVDTIWRDLVTFRNFRSKIKEEECEEDCEDVKIECSEHTDDEWNYFCEFMNVYLNVSGIKKYLRKDVFSISKGSEAEVRDFFPVMIELPDRTLANVIAISVLLKSMEEMNSHFRLKKLKHLLSIEELGLLEIDKEKYCVGWVGQNLHTVLLTEFLDKYLNMPSVNEIIELQDEYRTTLADVIASQDWIPPNEKPPLINTVKNTEINFIILKTMEDNETKYKASLSAFVEKLNFTQGDFFGNVLQMKKLQRNIFQFMNEDNFLFMFTNEMIKFAVQVSFPLLYMDKYAIDMGLGLLFPPYYIPGLNKNLHRVQFPQLLGHEIGHYLKEAVGKATEGTENSRETYLKKKLCLENQFSEFKLSLLNKSLNGSQYIIENMSDSVGALILDKIIESYNSSEFEILLPGLPYSTKQVLFMVANQFWCSKENLKTETRYVVYDAHAPLEFRLIGMMQNSRKFSEAFQCEVGSYMNPSSKCSFLDNV